VQRALAATRLVDGFSRVPFPPGDGRLEPCTVGPGRPRRRSRRCHLMDEPYSASPSGNGMARPQVVPRPASVPIARPSGTSEDGPT
jgi:hypothetical protein